MAPERTEVSGKTYNVKGHINMTDNGITWDKNSLQQQDLDKLREDFNQNRDFTLKDDRGHVIRYGGVNG